jgi:hypothetical protein
MRVVAGERQQIAAHRDFADVEFLEFERAMEGFFRRQRDRGHVAALDRRAAVEQRRGAVVVADRHAQFQGHSQTPDDCCGKLPYHTAIAWPAR